MKLVVCLYEAVLSVCWMCFDVKRLFAFAVCLAVICLFAWSCSGVVFALSVLIVK